MSKYICNICGYIHIGNELPEACPSGAISMIPTKMPKEQHHTQDTIEAMRILLKSKATQENISNSIPNILLTAIEKSNRIMAEDIIREAGFMLPQSDSVKEFLQDNKKYDNIPLDAVEKLLSSTNLFEETKKYKCSICGYIHEGDMPENFVCPTYKQPASVFTEI